MRAIFVELTGERRGDGSVLIRSDDLPMFCVVGDDEQSALDTAMAVLPEYLRLNVPDYVNVRQIPSALEVISHHKRILPAHIVAWAKDGDDSDDKATAA
jgi:hypothetical protein